MSKQKAVKIKFVTYPVKLLGILHILISALDCMPKGLGLDLWTYGLGLKGPGIVLGLKILVVTTWLVFILFHYTNCTNSELRILAVLSVLQRDLQYADI